MTAKQTDTRNDQYGGLTKIRTKATGCYRVERIGGRWWLITPDGNGFISIGMNHFDPTVLKISTSGKLSMVVAKNSICVKALPNHFENGGATRSDGWWLENG